jgi:protein tyrosine phosphatase (PTP) superfamily phosphohydrolase (DUF442 family)
MQRLVGLGVCLALFLGACGESERSNDTQAFVLGEREFRVNDHLVFSGQPSEARIGEIAAADFRLLVSLNPQAKAPPFDEAAAARAVGVPYEHLAIAKGPLFEDAALRERGYALFDKIQGDKVRSYFHCSSSNRVSALWAMYLVDRKGMPAEEALAEAKRLGLTKLEPLLRKHLGLPAD